MNADVEAIFSFNDGRKLFECFRTTHLVNDTYLATGKHHYYEIDEKSSEAKGTIEFISPQDYPQCLYIGKKIEMYDGRTCIGTAEITQIFNPILEKNTIIKSFDSESEMMEYLRKQDSYNVILLGEDSYVINSASAIVFDEYNLIIGLFTEGLFTEIHHSGIKNKENTIFVGFNDEVVCIKNSKVINKYKRWGSVFYEFLNVPDNENLLVAIFELGAACFDITGNIIWTYDAEDIVTDFKISNGVLKICTNDSEKIIQINR